MLAARSIAPGRTVKAGLALLAAALVALFAPTAASAETYVVNELGDAADAAVGSEGCDSVAGGAEQCTLRAAIQESNNSTVVDDTIIFAASFDGELADTIPIGASFPTITDKVTIDGDGVGQCTTAAAGVKGPCAGVEKTGLGGGLAVENSDGVTIEGLAITGVTGAGINVTGGSEGFTARDNWLGLKLNGAAGGNTTGIFLDPNSNGAQIGGTAATARNVFANNSAEGLDIQGASTTQVSGNYFGVAPDGSTQAANGKDVEVTSSFTVEATGNQIGAELSPEALGTPACDGACNVISGSLSVGVDLLGEGGGEEPPAKTTTVRGNFVGLTATGAALGNATIGIQAGKSKETTIGGPAASANHINGGSYGVSSGSLGVGADDLVVDGNLIGLNVAGTATLSPPSTAGVFDTSEGISSLAHTAEITDNRIAMTSGAAIEQHSIGALIAGNRIGRGAGGESLTAGNTGIKIWGPSILGSTVEDNVIDNPTADGILVENNNNQMIANTIEAADRAGIRIQSFGGVLEASGNAIGGDAEDEENAISNNGDAIQVAGPVSTDTQIKRNHGSGNSGLFIDLGADGAGNKGEGPNNGVQPPTISTATVSGASGTALPKATVRVFRKATASPGELQSFLGKATANGEGKWSLTYGAAIPGGTNIGATQSEIEGTSELVIAGTASPPEEKGGDNGGGGAGGSDKDKSKDQDKSKNKGKAKGKGDKKAPETTIVKGPRRTHKRTAKFKFVSSEANSTFQCKLDRRKFKLCSSPKKYKRLKPGKHVFEVRAIDAAGNKDKTPAKRKFRILP